MKKIIIALLVLSFALVPIFVIAQPRYEAKFSFSVSVNGEEVKKKSDFIYVYRSDILEIELNVKTNEDFYAGPLSTEIIFTDSYLDYETFEWNEKGRFYSSCKSYSNLSLNDGENSFLKLDMIPSSVDCNQAVNTLDESLLSMQFVSNGNRDDVAKVYLDSSTVRSNNNPFGSTYFACYTDKGNLNGKRYDFGNGINLDFSDAIIQIKITDAGDVNTDGTITAADSLSIMQYCTGIISLSDEQLLKADINYNGKVNSSDSLAALQLSAGINTINDIINN